VYLYEKKPEKPAPNYPSKKQTLPGLQNTPTSNSGSTVEPARRGGFRSTKASLLALRAQRSLSC